MSSLFFDEYAALLSFLQLPGNAQYGHRVVQIENVRKHGSPVSVWAVMVGVARFVENSAEKHAAPNCILQFDQAKGFDSILVV